MKVLLFDAALDARGITKREYANFAKIPYDTVTGWKKRDNVPEYALGILKTMPTKYKKTTKFTRNITKKVNIPNNYKIIQAAFWGKNVTLETILKGVEDADPEFLIPIFKNVFYKDIIALLGTEKIIALKPMYTKIMSKKDAEFWQLIAKAHRTRQ